MLRSCNSLKTVVIPEGVTSIERDAFYDCYRLQDVTIPTTLQSVGINAFAGCDDMNEVYISDLAAWCNIAFEDNPLYGAQALYLECRCGG